MKSITKMVLIFVMTMIILGCTSLYPPARKAMLQVESPPHRTTLICDADKMTPEMVAMCMKINNSVAFKDYKFNDSFTMDGSFVRSKTDIRTHSNTVSKE